MAEPALPEYRRIAVFGGVYSNAPALEAVLDDARARDVEAVFCLGDMGGFGPHPDRALARLRDSAVQALQGNYDESLARGRSDCGCGYTDPRDNYYARVSYQYTVRHTSADNIRWLASLPTARRIRLGERRALMCHGSPQLINEFLWESTTPNGYVRRLCRDHATDLIVCTHTGLKWERALPEGEQLVNVGVIGRPGNDGTRNVWYAVLSAVPDVQVEFIPVTYDWERTASEIEQEGLPSQFAETIRTGWWTTCLEVLPHRERARGRF